TASGAIAYRRSLRALDQDGASMASGMGGHTDGATSPPPPASHLGRSAHANEAGFVLQFRTGDSIVWNVERIDARGVHFQSPRTATRFAPHSQLQRVELQRSQDAPRIAPEKLRRLMTLPRSMRGDPPTHLLMATTGDYL